MGRLKLGQRGAGLTVDQQGRELPGQTASAYNRERTEGGRDRKTGPRTWEWAGIYWGVPK
jgi:hypothetical protein